jgi:phage terminase small subunit
VAAVTTLPDRSVNRAVGLPTRNKGVPADVAPTTGKPDDAALAKLTKKQQRFITEYLVDYNATRAAQRAGYGGSDRNLGIRGFKLLRHPVIGPEIRRRGAATPDELGVTREYVVAKLREVVERALGSDEGWTPQSALRGLELISRLRGDLVERTSAEVKVVQVQINDVNMQDLR